MNNSFVSFPKFVDVIKTLPRQNHTMLLAIDGCGASGKSTFAKNLQMLCSDISIVQMDDFFRPRVQRLPKEIAMQQIGADFDWQRLESQVLLKLRQNQAGNYQRYDWDSDTLAEWHEVPVGGIVVVEGIYSTRHELAKYYDLRILVDCPKELRLSRGIERDGENARHIWLNDWMPTEDKYIENQKPEKEADMVIDGSRLGDCNELAGFYLVETNRNDESS